MSKNFVIFCAVLTLILIGAAVFVSSSNKTVSQTTSVLTYGISDKEKPSAETESTKVSLGDMKVSDEKSADFKIKNRGAKPLQISNMKSSCGCTVGKIISNGTESQEFGMHSQLYGVISEILPGGGSSSQSYLPSFYNACLRIC